MLNMNIMDKAIVRQVRVMSLKHLHRDPAIVNAMKMNKKTPTLVLSFFLHKLPDSNPYWTENAAKH